MSTNSSEQYLHTLREAQTIRPDSLPEDFPYSEFQFNLTKYNEQEDWYSGSVLDAYEVIEGKKIDSYPIRINPIKGTCQRHVAMLFGDIQNDDKPLVTPKIARRPNATEEEKQRAIFIEDLLVQIWFENNGRSIQLLNGLVSQKNGGCVFYVKYDPTDISKSYPISIEVPDPRFFVGIPNSSNPNILEEAWLVKPISDVEIKNQGIFPRKSLLKQALNISEEFSGNNVHWLCEHFTRRTKKVTIDGKDIIRRVVLPSGNVEDVEFNENNPLGVVPIVYIPHIRSGINFYGENVFDNVRGIVKEMNSRVADYGDAVSFDSHDIVVSRNVNGKIEVTKLVPGITRVDVGSSINVTGQEAQPEMTSLKKSNFASETMDKLVNNTLYKQYRRDAIHPAVCDGEDEGSQRSSQTLTTRMWSLETHAMQERINWTDGMNLINKYILRTLSAYAPSIGITMEDEKFRIRQSWYPTLQRDRQELVTEIATRVGAKLLSFEHAVEMFNDIEDVDEEKRLVIEFQKMISEATVQKQAFGQMPDNANNNNPNATKASLKKES